MYSDTTPPWQYIILYVAQIVSKTPLVWRIASEILAAKITNGLCSGTLLTLVERVISFDDIAEEGDGVSRDVRWDASLPGFGVRIYPSGKKTFVLSYREAGRKRLMTLGAYGSPLSLSRHQ